MIFRLMTLNLHCFAEEDIPNKQEIIVETILSKKPDVICLQEVAQSRSEDDLSRRNIHQDNYGFRLVEEVQKRANIKYYFYYKSIKRSFDIYDEGVAILSLKPLREEEVKVISKTNDYDNWKKREILAYTLQNQDEQITIATTHFGWSDGYEVFEDQFCLATENIKDKPLTILAGDFNIRFQSDEYKYITKQGWHDLFIDDLKFCQLPTFRGDFATNDSPARLDYIMTNHKVKCMEKEILFGENRVSDHYGIFVVLNTNSLD